MWFFMAKLLILHSVVPDPPTGVTYYVFGTADIQINWTVPSSEDLRGQNRTYYVRLPNGEIQVDDPSVLVNASVGVLSGTFQDIAVSI